MCDGDDVRPCLNRTERLCLICNLAWPRDELPEGANQSSVSASSGLGTGKRPHTVTKSVFLRPLVSWRTRRQIREL